MRSTILSNNLTKNLPYDDVEVDDLSVALSLGYIDQTYADVCSPACLL
jgi:hypothetical protein